MSLLWKITKAKIEAPSYIVGTMHIRDQRAFYLLDTIHKKIQECEAFATEFKLDEADPNEIKKYMLLPDETTLDDYIKPKRYTKIDAFLMEKIGMSLTTFSEYKPLFINNFLTEAFFQEDMPLALDAALYQYAGEQGKVLLGIETYQEQLDVLTQIPIKVQVKGLWSMVKNYEEFCTEMRQLADLYQVGDIEKIYNIAHKGAEGMRNLMIHNRNKNMANRIAKMVKTQTMCIALGAAHLGGKRGVLNRLRKKGFECVALG